ncbi:MAG TPA: MacB family efflux pump subunit [Bradyrhizobium sp.]|nr:MacB family efflux pump subunit [Bradyrhizobium sp.]
MNAESPLPPPATEPLIELSEVSKLYPGGGTIAALDRVTLSIERGEYVAIMGQSGSGKTTLMNLIGCLDRPTAGGLRVAGRDVAELDADGLADLRRNVFGFVFQRYNLLGTASAVENVEMPAVYAGVGHRDRIARAKLLLERLGLADRSHHRPSQLSGGQQQRVSIARALMNGAEVILADEPTGALDSRSGTEVLELLDQLHREGHTILLITHDQAIASRAQRVIRIHDGRIVADSGRRIAGLGNAEPAQGVRADGHGTAPAFLEAVKMALRSLRVNLFRTILTLLGIVIGVASVVTMLAVGDGSRQVVIDRISAMGTNLLLIRPGGPNIRSSGDNATLIPDDAAAIARLPNVLHAAPERNGSVTLRFGDQDYATVIHGTWPGFTAVHDWPVEQGAFFTEEDLRSYAPVIVLGRTVVTNLFGEGVDPVGRYVLVKNIPFEVIGVMSVKGATPSGADFDDIACVPLSTGLMRIFGKNYVNIITAQVADVSQIDATQAAITRMLIQRHRTENFQIRNMASILDTVSQTAGTLTALLGSVAAISLLVGGIGVMNIMLVNVTERTREIGLRMATGARTRDILLQFNAEAVVVCGIGGAIGVALGILASRVAHGLGLPITLSAPPALMAFACAFLTGVVFGYLPARKAARLDPVVALASE